MTLCRWMQIARTQARPRAIPNAFWAPWGTEMCGVQRVLGKVAPTLASIMDQEYKQANEMSECQSVGPT